MRACVPWPTVSITHTDDCEGVPSAQRRARDRAPLRAAPGESGATRNGAPRDLAPKTGTPKNLVAKATANRAPALHRIPKGMFMRRTLGTPVNQLLGVCNRGLAGLQAHDPCQRITD